ncbi:MAG: hypothetical protein WCO42_01025 [bacterium]
MNDLNKLLNEPEVPKLTVNNISKKIEKPTAAAIKANILAAQENTMAAASVGSPLFRSAKDFLVANPEVKAYKK